MFNVFNFPLQREQKKIFKKNQIFFIFKKSCIFAM